MMTSYHHTVLFCLVICIGVVSVVAKNGITPAATTTGTTAATTTGTTAATTTGTPAATTVAPTSGATTQTPLVTTVGPAPTTGMTTANQTVTTAAVTGNSTANATVSTAVPTTTVPLPATPRFQVNNSDGDPCMLLNFNAMLTVNYTTTDKAVHTAEIPIMNTTAVEGFCNNGTLRNFTLYYPNNSTYCAFLTLFFNMTSKTAYYNREGIYLRYIEPCFPADVVNYNTATGGHFSPTYYGTVGKSYKCNSISRTSTKLSLTLVLNDILIQPFAEMSANKGDYGEIETCPKVVPTSPVPSTAKPHPPTKPSPNKSGKIVGIVIGVLAVVGTIIAVVVYMVRKRRYKPVSYGNLEDDPTRAI